MTKITKVNIYRDTSTGKWYYSAWCGEEHNHNDIILTAESETEAMALIQAMWPSATVRTVAPVSAE